MRVARALYRFNTQPLEGGCALTNSDKAHSYGFNTQPLEGGCQQKRITTVVIEVSTHSRPKAAAKQYEQAAATQRFQHTAARRRLQNLVDGERA